MNPELLQKYIAGNATEAEKQRVTKWIQENPENMVSIRPRACFFPLFSFLPLWLHYNLNPLCVQY